MNIYIPWSFVTFLLGWVSCVSFFLLLAKAGEKMQARKMTATQKKYKAALDAAGEEAGNDLNQMLDELQGQLDALKGNGDV